MAVCKHCGTEIEDGLDYCPNCGQKIEEEYGDFFEPDEKLEEEAYNIFDAPDEFNMDSLLSKEFGLNNENTPAASNFSSFETEKSISDLEVPDSLEEAVGFKETTVPEELSGLEEFNGLEELGGLEALSDLASAGSSEDTESSPMFEEVSGDTEEFDLAQMLGLSEDAPEEIEEFQPVGAGDGGIEFPEAEESDFIGLDGLLQDFEEEPEELKQTEEEETIVLDEGLEALLAASEASARERSEKKKKNAKETKEKKPLLKRIFGNVPIDPSKIKPEPTPEQIAAKKQKEAEEKKAKAEEKKLAAEEKKQAKQRDKEEKARQKMLAKEEKKAKKLEEAKKILEEMQDSRINRLGASLVFIFFAVCAVALFFGSDLFGYTVSVNNAEKSFNKALNNNVKYYTDAYNEIYGLEIKEEDQVLNDKIMTVMFVNKQLNSYNSYMRLENYEAALHSLLKGLQRYGAYYEHSIPLGVDRDMDFVRTQILKELKNTFGVSEDEAEVLRSMLEATSSNGIDVLGTSINDEAARLYNVELYEIVKESELRK